MNLPETYASVCAKRPDLAVPRLAFHSCACGAPACGQWDIPTRPTTNSENPQDPIAAALILARWVEALPEWCDVTRVNNDTESGEQRWSVGLSEGPNPLEALAAYYLGEAT